MPKLTPEKTYQYALYSLAFTLSFPYYLFPISLVLISITALRLRFIEKNWEFFKPLVFLYLALFAYIVIRIIGNNNVHYGFHVLERNLPLLIIPLLLIPKKMGSQKIFLKVFVLGISLAGIITLSGTIYDQISGRSVALKWYYDSFYTYGFHPTYMAMYALVAIIMLSYRRLFSQRITLALKAFLSLFVLISASRIAIIFLLIMGIYRIIAKRDRFFIYAISAIFLVLVGMFNFSSDFRLKINELKNFDGFTHYDNDNYGSVSVRVAKIKASVMIWEEHKWFGVGTGDYLDALEKKYRSQSIQCWPCAKKRYNSHNQYLNTLVSHGLAGFALFFLIGGYLLFIAWRTQNKMLIGIILVFATVSLTESILEVRRGIYIVFLLLYYLPLINSFKKNDA